MSKPIKKMNKKKKFVADGVFHAELHAFLSRALLTAGFSGIEIRTFPIKTEIRVKATKPQEVMGPEGRKLRELEYLIAKRFGYNPKNFSLAVQPIQHRGICAAAQAESLKFKLLNNIPLRLAAQAIIKSILKDKGGARGCEIKISGKLKQQRAKSMKFKSGYMVMTGQPKNDYLDVAVRHVFFKQGIMGIRVRIMLPHDPTGKSGPMHPLPDNVVILDKKEEQQEDIKQSREQPQQAQQ